MRSAPRLFALGASILLCLAQPAAAQYMRITTDNPTDNTRLRPGSGATTLLTITLDTSHDRGGSLQSCNSHSNAAGCGSVLTGQPLDMFSYTISLAAVGGVVQFGTFTAADANYTPIGTDPKDNLSIEINRGRPAGTVTPQGLSMLGSIPVTVLAGTPRIDIANGPTSANPSGFGTGFGTPCDGFNFLNTYVLGDPADVCNTGDWFDWDGAAAPAQPGSPPTLDPIANMTVGAGGCAPSTADQAISATDPDGDAITFTSSGPAWMTVTSNAQVGNTRTGNIHLSTPPSGTSGNFPASVTATAGGLSDTKSFTISVIIVNQPPVLAQPPNMTVFEGATANQTLSGSDPCGAPLTFFKVSGPTYMTVTTINATTGNVNLAPGLTDEGTATATVGASNGTLSTNKSFTVTVMHQDLPLILSQPANMTVNEGATANQTLTATDPDGNAITFSKVSGPTYVTVTTTSPGTGTGTGNVNVAPGSSDAGTATVTVRASDNGSPPLSDDKSFKVTVNDINRAPVLAQPANMTVNQGSTANQTLTATDPDGNAITFSKVSGPTYVTVTTTSPGTGTGTGNVNVAPGFSDAGTATVSVSASDGSLGNDKSFTITVMHVDQPPVLNQPANMTVNEGATANQTVTATHPQGAQITFTFSGPSFMTLASNPQVGNTRTANIHLTPGFADAGTYPATVRVTDGVFSDEKSFTITVNDINRAPVLAQPANMMVTEGSTANQTLAASDPDGNAITFTKVSGPTYVTVTTTSPGTGTGTGNVNVAPGFVDAGTATVSVSASDGSLSNGKSFTVTVLCAGRGPVLAQPANMTVNEGATANQPLTATDPDGNALTFSKVSGPTYMTVTTTSPGTGTATGNINLAPGFSDAGTATAAVAAGHGGPCPGSDTKSFTITVNNVNRPPVLTQPANLTVNEGSTAEILVTGSDPDNDPLTFMLDGCGGFSVFDPITRRIRITPGFNDAGVYTCTVTVSDGQASDSKTITITVLNVNRAPTLNPVANMTTMEGGGCRDDQVIAGSDPDADALTFFKTAGPTFMTVTTTSPTTGNIHLAAGFSDAGVFSATVSASDGSLSDSKSFTITVSSVNRAPVLAQPANMTVTEGATANQTITASDPDGCPITFSKVSGPSFMTVTTSSPTTGNIALAPGFSDAGTYGATVTASDGTVSDSKSFSITVNNSVPPLTLTQPSNMTVNEGGTADQSLIATDPAGLPVTFSKVSGPIFMTVTTTDPGAGTSAGNVHLAPGSADAGTYTAVVRATDTSGASDQKAFTITVINVNHEPVSDPNGPYSGIVGVPVNFNGSASSDPDGDPLTYEWDFDASDGITVDATGPTSSHTYTTTEVFTVTLTVEDNGSPNLSDTATTTATITTELPANVFLQTTGILKLKSNKPRYCFQIEPVNGSYNNTDVILSSVVLKYGDLEAPAEIGRTSIDADVNGNGVHEIRACFTTASLRTVFAGLPAGDNTATVALEGDLTTGGRFRGTTEIVVRGPVSGSASATSSVSPNPLNPHSTLFFTTSEPGLVSVAMYDLQGRLVRTILSPTFMPAGTHEAVIDGRGAGGEKLPSGVYFIRGVSAEGEFKQVITILK